MWSNMRRRCSHERDWMCYSFKYLHSSDMNSSGICVFRCIQQIFSSKRAIRTRGHLSRQFFTCRNSHHIFVNSTACPSEFEEIKKMKKITSSLLRSRTTIRRWHISEVHSGTEGSFVQTHRQNKVAVLSQIKQLLCSERHTKFGVVIF